MVMIIVKNRKERAKTRSRKVEGKLQGIKGVEKQMKIVRRGKRRPKKGEGNNKCKKWERRLKRKSGRGRLYCEEVGKRDEKNTRKID
jgi:hypothetical protein